MMRRLGLACTGSGLLLAVLTGAASALPISPKNCIAADIALGRGFIAGEGTSFVDENGKTLTRGKAVRTTAYKLSQNEELELAPVIDKLAPGAVEYVTKWLIPSVPYASAMDSTEMSEDARSFISLYQSCLNAYGPDMIP
jgi:hypothetical protein